ncbi:MAG: ATP-dependent helicase UvrD/PcrA [Pseudonocardiales bacterium]|nr:ATP-dependent helicase UvrD/PcrA [Pseudonocardiales bacterium]
MSDAEAVLAGLDPEQTAAVLAVRGPVCILAGAGTGKTRAITHRIAYAVRSGQIPAGQLLAVTFTARAAGELRNRLRRLGAEGVQARTFHAAALRQLTYFAPRVLGGAMPDLVDKPLSMVGNAAARLRLRTDRAEVRDLAAEIEWAKAVLVTPDDYAARAAAAGRETSTTAETVAKVYAEYEKVKRRSGQVDFADLLLIMAGAIDEYADVAEEVRRRYRHFVVDEYQDVSPLQQRLLDAWLGDRQDLCVVGDANQTIYSFAGATPAHLLGFRRRFPDAVVVRLERDYRSTPQVVALANGLLRDGAEQARLTLVGQRPDGPEPTFAEFDDEPAEAAAAALQCRTLIDSGTPAAEIAVLFRINAQSEVYEQALADQRVPYVLRGGERFFDRAEIREARLLLRGAARAGQDGDELPDAVRSVLAGLNWHADTPPPGGTARERWESLAALVGLADDLLATNPQAQLAELVAELDARAGAQHAPTVQGVTLASLHSAKGLEWDVVFLVGLTDTTLPIQHATTPEALAEERRLLYVGITRARERLALSWALARSPGQRRGRRPSRFLDGLRPSGSHAPPRPKAKAVAPEAADAELFGRLRAWRKLQAEGQGVPPYIVFSDATLVAIADARPGTRSELARISGVGPTKLERYAEPLLAVLGGADPPGVELVEVG